METLDKQWKLQFTTNSDAINRVYWIFGKKNNDYVLQKMFNTKFKNTSFITKIHYNSHSFKMRNEIPQKKLKVTSGHRAQILTYMYRALTNYPTEGSEHLHTKGFRNIFQFLKKNIYLTSQNS